MANSLDDQVGVDELVPLATADRVEADAEGLQAALALLGQQRDDQARVEAAREQHADGHVGDHPPARPPAAAPRARVLASHGPRRARRRRAASREKLGRQ